MSALGINLLDDLLNLLRGDSGVAEESVDLLEGSIAGLDEEEVDDDELEGKPDVNTM